MKRNTYLISAAIVLAAVLSAVLFASNSRYDRIHDSLKGLGLYELNEKGKEYLARSEADSALVCFLSMTALYSDKMSDHDKRLCSNGYNNAGYVYSFMLGDAPSAQMMLLKALDIAKATDDKEAHSAPYLNLGNIYVYYEDYENALKYYGMAYDSAKEGQQWDILINAFANIATLLYAHDPNGVRHYVDDFKSYRVPDVEMADYAETVAKMADLRLKGDNEGALRMISEAMRLIDAKYQPEGHMLSLIMNRSEILRDMARHREAISSMKSMDSPGSHDFPDIMMDISKEYASIGMQDSATWYRIKSLELRDSLNIQKEYTLVSNSDRRYEVAEFERNIRESEIRRQNHRTVAIISIGFAAVLAVILIVLIRKNKRLKEALEDLYLKSIERHVENTEDKTAYKEVTERHEEEKGVAESCATPFTLDEGLCKEIYEKTSKVMDSPEMIKEQDFSLKELARLTDVNTRYLSHVINTRTGKSFSVLLNEKRIKEAQKILSDPDESKRITIEGVAYDTGFKSQSNFVNVFKKETGLTPTEYRRMAGKQGNHVPIRE